MEIVLALIAIIIVGVLIHHNITSGRKATAKVEAPAQESAPVVAEPAKEVTSVTASKPARAPKAPAAVKKKPAAPAKAKAKAPAKKPAPKKPAPKKAVKTVAKK